jgi:hypothetical protein
MLIDGLNVVEGSVISNLTVASGTSFPSNAAAGELFFRTDLNALHVYNNSAWVKTIDSASGFLAANTAITAGTNTKITYDANGLVTAGTSPTTLAGYGITDAVLSNSAITAGTYKSVTVDNKGLVTAGTNPTTLAGYGITDAAAIGGSTSQSFSASTVNASGSLLPTVTSTQDIGSTSMRWRAIYVDDMYLSTNTLYLGDTPVMGTNANTIEIKADPDQSMLIKTQGTGQTQIQSAGMVNISTASASADILIQTTGVGSMSRLQSATEVRATAPAISLVGDTTVTGAFTVSSGLTVNGALNSINSTNLAIKDNVVLLNAGEAGNGVTGTYAGLQFDRGGLADWQLVFDESDDKLKFGAIGSLTTLITTGDTSSVTNTMLAGSIANAKLANSSVTVGSTAISLGASATTLAGLTSVTSTTFVGALTGNASTATSASTLTTARTINGTSFDGSANITVTSAAGTLTGASLNATVTGSSLTSVGNLTGLTMAGNIVVPTGSHITLTDAPVSGTDAVNKTYVDNNLAGLTWKNSVKVATTANITLSGTQTIDGVAVVAGNRVLVKDQTTTSQNGVYVVAAGAWARSTDMDGTTPLNEFNSAAVFVELGTANVDTGWTQINDVTTIGTSPVAFAQFNGAAGITAGTGLVKSGNTLDVNMGAGIAQLPTDEVGVDVYAGGGLMTTVDGTASSTATAAQLSLTKVGTAGTYKSVTVDSYGRITAGSTTVNAETATVLQTARTINGTSFDGSANITVTAAAGTLTGTTLNATVTGSSLTSVGTITTGTWSGSFGAVSGANLTSLTAGNLSGTIPAAVLANSTHYIGTTAVTLNRASTNLALTGISSVALPGSSSGTVTLQATATAGTTTITLPGTTGTVITTGDTGTVTNTMLANSSVTVGSTAISLGASATTLAGLTSVTSTTFVGALTGTATNATNVALADAANTAASFYIPFASAATGNNALKTDAGITYNPSTNTLTTIASSAQYADLAEKYVADAEYAPGTVLAFGGDKEVTVSSANGDRKVIGVVTTNPAYLMNDGLVSEFVAAIALQGRVPCKVTGNVAKGDMMVSNGDGTARAEADPKVGSVIGKALENFVGTTGTIEVLVGKV